MFPRIVPEFIQQPLLTLSPDDRGGGGGGASATFGTTLSKRAGLSDETVQVSECGGCPGAPSAGALGVHSGLPPSLAYLHASADKEQPPPPSRNATFLHVLLPSTPVHGVHGALLLRRCLSAFGPSLAERAAQSA
jgi:hypothetical protein